MIAEELWKQHEIIQAGFKAAEKFYEKWETVLMDLDERRQVIVKKYYQTDENGKLLEDNNGQYKLKKGMRVDGYDSEMILLMNANVHEPVENSVQMKIVEP